MDMVSDQICTLKMQINNVRLFSLCQEEASHTWKLYAIAEQLTHLLQLKQTTLYCWRKVHLYFIQLMFNTFDIINNRYR